MKNKKMKMKKVKMKKKNNNEKIKKIKEENKERKEEKEEKPHLVLWHSVFERVFSVLFTFGYLRRRRLSDH